MTTTDSEEDEEPQEGFSIEGAQAYLEDFKRRLADFVPDPTERRLMDGEVEYTPEQLTAMLQEYGAYLANLAALKGKMEADHNILTKGYKAGMKIGIAMHTSSSTTIAGREAEFLGSGEGESFRNVMGDIIKSESCLMLVKGWLESYEAAYAAVSRVVSLAIGEASVASNRHP